MSSKTCEKCGKNFKGFGNICSDCRRAGLTTQGTAKACKLCGNFFSGFGDICEDCTNVTSAGRISRKVWDADGVPLEDTNVAGLGSDEDKALRKQAAGTEPAWAGIGLEPGLWIFRIESFQVVPWPKEKWGKFHSGDSYITLSVQQGGEEGEEDSEKLEKDIFFWLGSKTSTDEKGVAAYKTVELDDFFDGEATQHREVQGMESEEFLALFPKGIDYLAGGVESGFNVTQVDVFLNKLYQVRRNDKKKIIIEEEAVALSTLNHRDCFILDTGRKIYVWFGDNASPFTKNACTTKAENMESERDGESEVVTEIDDEFWTALGGQGDITPADQVGAEVEADHGEGILYSIQVSEEDRTLSVTEVGRGELSRSLLDPSAVMMLDTRVEIFMWLGDGASEVEKRSAFTTANNYLKMNQRDPNKTSITVLKQGKGRKNKIWAQTFSD